MNKFFNKRKSDFNIKNYFDMYKARGIRLVLEYFFYNHLFDIFRGTDTHSWNFNNTISTKDDEDEIYMSSWSKDIIIATKLLEKILSKEVILKSTFIDIGSGKGKVLLTWKKLYRENKEIYGIEYDKKLAKITYSNFCILGYKPVKVFIEDISKVIIPKNKNEEFMIFLMYHPTGRKKLEKFFANNSYDKSAIIYFNPILTSFVKELGFNEIYNKKSYRDGSCFKIFLKN